MFSQIPASVWKLPDKIEFDIYVPLTQLQRSIYLALLSRNPDLLQQLIAIQRRCHDQNEKGISMKSKDEPRIAPGKRDP